MNGMPKVWQDMTVDERIEHLSNMIGGMSNNVSRRLRNLDELVEGLAQEVHKLKERLDRADLL
jgi:hypothetical protein